MLFIYVAVMSGAPLPAGKARQKSGELFPCTANDCGCDSAERCWSSCCCHTLAERLTWAKERGVRPPGFALAEGRSAGLDISHWDGTTKVVTATIAVTNRPSCCAKKTAAAQSCCSKKLAGGCCASNRKAQRDDNNDRGVVGWRALACRGQSLTWLAAVPSLITVEHELADQLPLVSWMTPPSSEIAAGVADVPTPPPPERA
jgi:hypothetical protein